MFPHRADDDGGGGGSGRLHHATNDLNFRGRPHSHSVWPPPSHSDLCVHQSVPEMSGCLLGELSDLKRILMPSRKHLIKRVSSGPFGEER